jgi:DNA-binding NtrC family response regulator
LLGATGWRAFSRRVIHLQIAAGLKIRSRRLPLTARSTAVLRALETCAWNKMHAAAMLNISRKKLYAKINKYQLEELRESS